MGKFSWLCSAGIASVIGFVQPALAQDASSAADASGPSDIVVTARRVEERLQDVPISITVFNQAQLTTRNVVNAGDLATYTPSLTANGRFGAENTSFAIRGFAQDNGTAPSVAVYFADVAALRAAGGTTLGNGAGPGSFFDLQNVQVLKGSQGTLFGRNTTGGAVLLVPQKPTSKFEGYVEGSLGSDRMRRIQAVINAPLSDSIRVRLGVDHQTRDGYLHNKSGIGPKDFADTDYTAVRGSIVIDLAPDVENYTIGTWSDSDTNGFLPQPFVCAPGVLTLPATASAALRAAATANQGVANLACSQIARQAATGDYYAVENATLAPRQHTRQWQAINTTTWRASDNLTIKNIASYGEFREYFRSSVYGEDLILTSGPQTGQRIIKAQSAPPPGGDSAGESTFTEELQAQGTAMSDRLNYQFGGYTEQSNPIGLTGAVSPSSAVCLTANSLQCVSAGVSGVTSLVIGRLNKQRFRDYGLYGQATYKLTDQLSLTGGARYTWDSTRATTQQIAYVPLPITTNPPIGRCLVGAVATGTSDACATTFKQKASKPTWLADVDYKPTDDLLLYLKYARGYRAGGIKTDGGASFAVFGPEKVDTYEGGLKASFRGSVPGTFNVTGFYSDFFHQQLAARLDPNPTGTIAGSTPAQVIASVGRSRIYGVEVEGSVTPFTGLTFDANYAYLNSRLKSLDTLPGASTALYLTPIPSLTAVGYPLGYTPKNKFSVTATYRLPLDESVGRVSVGATFSHSDKQLTTAGYIIPVVAPTASNPTPIVPSSVVGGNFGVIRSINLLNLSANWNSVFGKPLDLAFFMTNATNKHYVAAVFGGIGAFGFDSRALAEPREFGFRGKVRF